MRMPRRSSRFLPPLALLLAVSLRAAAPDLGPGHSFTPRRSWTDELGQTHTHYAHWYLGYRVWGSEWIDHQGPGAAPPTLALTEPVGLPPGWQHLLDTPPPGAEPILYGIYEDIPGTTDPDAEQVDHHLVATIPAYFWQAQPDTQEAGEPAYDLITDASDGTVLWQGAVQETASAATGTGKSLYRGQVTLNLTAGNGGYLLQDQTRGRGGPMGSNAVLNGKYSEALPVPYFNATPTWGDGRPEGLFTDLDSPTGQTMAVDLAAGIQTSWDYFLRIHGRLGPDGNGGAVTGVAHAYNPFGPFDNAFWTARENTISVLQPLLQWPLTTLQILGHEFSHGVTEFTAGLVGGATEANGMNEGNSDIFGTMLDTWARNGAGSTIGEGATWQMTWYLNDGSGQPQPATLRDMVKPSTVPPSVDFWSLDIANLDCHHSAGPLNRAFYFLSAGSSGVSSAKDFSTKLQEKWTGIGNDEAARIWYRALNTYLTSNARYADARNAALQAALDLFGSGSAEVTAVAKSFAAVNVGQKTPDQPSPGALTAAATPQGGQLQVAAAGPAGAFAVKVYVDQIPVAYGDKPPFSQTLDAGRLLANGTHSVSSSALGNGGPYPESARAAFTLASPMQQIVLNPGFEGLSRGWGDTARALTQFDTTGAASHGGIWWLRFDRTLGKQNLTIRQPVTLPADASSATLECWVRTRTGLPKAPDTFTLQIGPYGGTATTLATWDTSGPLGVWLPRRLDLSAYAGQAVQLSFTSNISSGTGTSFDLDDVTLVVAPTAPVAVTVAPGYLEVQPGTSAATALAATVTGSANTAVTWTALGGGSVDTNGNYTPPASAGIYTVKATSAADPGAFATVAVRVKPLLAFTPDTVVLGPGESRTLTLQAGPGVAPVLKLGGGSSPGSFQQQADPTQIVYVAPSSPGTYILAAQDPASGAQASAQLVVTPALTVTVTPPNARLALGGTRPFTATVAAGAVNWSVWEAGGGTVSPTGVYTAPMTAGTYHVVATSALDSTKSTQAAVEVIDGLVLDPPAASVLVFGKTSFTALVPGYGDPSVTWTVQPGGAGGTLAGGTYTAPATPGVDTLTATSVANPALNGTATVKVRTTDLNGNGQLILDWGDLAAFADAWGTQPVVDAADFDGNGVVDDQDLKLFWTLFGGNP